VAEHACHPGDKDALLASWTPEASCCDEDWQHVECDDDTGRVISLSVILEEDDDGGSSSLAGTTIPDAVAGLDHLENLDLRRLSGISGPIARLSNLAFLTISRTAVSGPLPSFLGELTALTELDLSYNSLSGSIPASLARRPNLWSVDVRHNRLTGTLPPLLFSSNNKKQQQQQDDESYDYLLAHPRFTTTWASSIALRAVVVDFNIGLATGGSPWTNNTSSSPAAITLKVRSTSNNDNVAGRGHRIGVTPTCPS
jgi:hypothetical protein